MQKELMLNGGRAACCAPPLQLLSGDDDPADADEKELVEASVLTGGLRRPGLNGWMMSAVAGGGGWRHRGRGPERSSVWRSGPADTTASTRRPFSGSRRASAVSSSASSGAWSSATAPAPPGPTPPA
jgi:hypothetical protein